MRINSLEIRNVLRIKYLKIDPLGDFTIIRGKSDTGKTTVLTAFTEGLQWSGVDPHLIHATEDEGGITIVIEKGPDQGHIDVDRKLTRTGQRLKVTDDGHRVSDAQTFIDRLCGPLNFNPVAFLGLSPKEQRDYLVRCLSLHLDAEKLYGMLGDYVIPINLNAFDYSKKALTVIEHIRTEVKEQRTAVNAEKTRLTKSLESDRGAVPKDFDAKRFDGFDFNARMKELSDAQRIIGEGQLIDTKLKNRIAERDRIQNRIDTLEDELRRLRQDLETAETDINHLGDAQAEFIAPNVTTLQAEIEEYNRSRQILGKIDEIKVKESQLSERTEAHEALDKLYKALVKEIPEALLKEADLPIPGLSITDEEILIDGFSLKHLGTAKAVIITVQLAKGLSKDLHFILVDGWESLDPQLRKTFVEEARNEPDGKSFQYIVTEVTDGEFEVVME